MQGKDEYQLSTVSAKTRMGAQLSDSVCSGLTLEDAEVEGIPMTAVVDPDAAISVISYEFAAALCKKQVHFRSGAREEVSLSAYGGTSIPISKKYVSAQGRVQDGVIEQDLLESTAATQLLVLGLPALVSIGVKMTTAGEQEILLSNQPIFSSEPFQEVEGADHHAQHQ